MKSIYTILLILLLSSIYSQSQGDSLNKSQQKRKGTITFTKKPNKTPTCELLPNNLFSDILPQTLTYKSVTSKAESARWIVTAITSDNTSLTLTFNKKPTEGRYSIVNEDISDSNVSISLSCSSGVFSMEPGGGVEVLKKSNGTMVIKICGKLQHSRTSRDLMSNIEIQNK